MKDHVTIAIPTYNAAYWLADLLKGIAAQKTKRQVEILIIDSGSTDETLQILKDHPKVLLHQIPNSEFSHGGTRNLAVKLAKGEFILFLTQDAIPAHRYWLEAMVEPFEISDKVGAVVGKQIPWPDAPVTIKREVYSVFRGLGSDDSVSLARQNDFTKELGLVNTFMSNTNSAVRKDLHAKIPFREVNYAEDQGLGIDIVKAGYYKAYAPLGSVNHSNDYGVREYFRRKFDEYVGLRETTGHTAAAGARELILGSTKATLRDWQFLIKDKQYSLDKKLVNFIKAPGYNIGLRLAIRAAANKKIDEKKSQRYSLEARAKNSKND
jgi:rhamnosyltransferase